MAKLILLSLLLVAISGLSIIEDHAAKALPRKFRLTFDYAAPEGVDPKTCSFTISWNGRQLQEIFPKDHYVNTFTIFLLAKVGENILDFAGTGTNGATIDNVQLRRKAKCGEEDVMNNGGFDRHTEVGSGKKIFKGKIEGWVETNKGDIEIGDGQLYNKHWKWGAVCNLGANAGRTDIYSSIFFNHKFEQVAADQIAPAEN